MAPPAAPAPPGQPSFGRLLADLEQQSIPDEELASAFKTLESTLKSLLGHFKPAPPGAAASAPTGEDEKAIASRLSRQANLDSAQAADLLKTFKADCGITQQLSSVDDAFVARLLDFYYEERLALMQCVASLLRIVGDEGHPYRERTERAVKAAADAGLAGALLQQARQRVQAASQAPPAGAAAAPHARACVQEATASIEALFLYYYTYPSACTAQAAAELTKVLSEIGFGAGLEAAAGAPLDEASRAAAARFPPLATLALVECLCLEQLLPGAARGSAEGHPLLSDEAGVALVDQARTPPPSPPPSSLTCWQGVRGWGGEGPGEAAGTLAWACLLLLGDQLGAPAVARLDPRPLFARAFAGDAVGALAAALGTLSRLASSYRDGNLLAYRSVLKVRRLPPPQTRPPARPRRPPRWLRLACRRSRARWPRAPFSPCPPWPSSFLAPAAPAGLACGPLRHPPGAQGLLEAFLSGFDLLENVAAQPEAAPLHVARMTDLAVAIFEGAPSLCEQFWEEGRRGRGTVQLLEYAASRFPAQWDPLLRLCAALSGAPESDPFAGYEEGEAGGEGPGPSLEPATPPRAPGPSAPEAPGSPLAARSVLEYLSRLPTYTAPLPPGDPASRGVQLNSLGGLLVVAPGGYVDPASGALLRCGTPGRLVSHGEPRIVEWEMPYSAWALLASAAARRTPDAPELLAPVFGLLAALLRSDPSLAPALDAAFRTPDEPADRPRGAAGRALAALKAHPGARPLAAQCAAVLAAAARAGAALHLDAATVLRVFQAEAGVGEYGATAGLLAAARAALARGGSEGVVQSLALCEGALLCSGLEAPLRGALLREGGGAALLAALSSAFAGLRLAHAAPRQRVGRLTLRVLAALTRLARGASRSPPSLLALLGDQAAGLRHAVASHLSSQGPEDAGSLAAALELLHDATMHQPELADYLYNAPREPMATGDGPSAPSASASDSAKDGSKEGCAAALPPLLARCASLPAPIRLRLLAAVRALWAAGAEQAPVVAHLRGAPGFWSSLAACALQGGGPGEPAPHSPLAAADACDAAARACALQVLTAELAPGGPSRPAPPAALVTAAVEPLLKAEAGGEKAVVSLTRRALRLVPPSAPAAALARLEAAAEAVGVPLSALSAAGRLQAPPPPAPAPLYDPARAPFAARPGPGATALREAAERANAACSLAEARAALGAQSPAPPLAPAASDALARALLQPLEGGEMWAPASGPALAAAASAALEVVRRTSGAASPPLLRALERALVAASEAAHSHPGAGPAAPPQASHTHAFLSYCSPSYLFLFSCGRALLEAGCGAAQAAGDALERDVRLVAQALVRTLGGPKWAALSPPGPGPSSGALSCDLLLRPALIPASLARLASYPPASPDPAADAEAEAACLLLLAAPAPLHPALAAHGASEVLLRLLDALTAAGPPARAARRRPPTRTRPRAPRRAPAHRVWCAALDALAHIAPAAPAPAAGWLMEAAPALFSPLAAEAAGGGGVTLGTLRASEAAAALLASLGSPRRHGHLDEGAGLALRCTGRSSPPSSPSSGPASRRRRRSGAAVGAPPRTSGPRRHRRRARALPPAPLSPPRLELAAAAQDHAARGRAALFRLVASALRHLYQAYPEVAEGPGPRELAALPFSPETRPLSTSRFAYGQARPPARPVTPCRPWIRFASGLGARPGPAAPLRAFLEIPLSSSYLRPPLPPRPPPRPARPVPSLPLTPPGALHPPAPPPRPGPPCFLRPALHSRLSFSHLSFSAPQAPLGLLLSVTQMAAAALSQAQQQRAQAEAMPPPPAPAGHGHGHGHGSHAHSASASASASAALEEEAADAARLALEMGTGLLVAHVGAYGRTLPAPAAPQPMGEAGGEAGVLAAPVASVVGSGAATAAAREWRAWVAEEVLPLASRAAQLLSAPAPAAAGGSGAGAGASGAPPQSPDAGRCARALESRVLSLLPAAFAG
eukprot:tig00000157_g9619.t1